ncbi:[FeFe] hydrogenase, group A [Veillonella sp.]|uniref:[FeFe] hydrogenase, group A n=1 Tax=Veillonella sp. TaxID=1926307 RepID=UPI0025FBEB20|nr:[FeFe] hydrogenase, group A [Veillonella sp.]
MSFESRFQHIDRRVPISENNPAIIHDLTKCKNCTLCRRACADVMGVLDYYDLESTGDEPICVHCGQCAAACPFDSMNERSELDEVKAAIADPDKIVVIQTAPAVRVGIGEEFGYEPGFVLEGKMIGALRQLGADYVVDTNFGADLTIMEEASELIERVVNGHGELPQFTSCCPAWVKFCETYYPEYLPNISTTRSCIAMEAAVIKTYFAKKMNIDPEKIVSVSVAPCTAKKFEIRRPEQNKSAAYWEKEELRDTDYCITTREFGKWIRESGIDFIQVEESQMDKYIGAETGGSVIFCNTGGVMEAAVRSAYKFITGEEPTPERYTNLQEVRGMEGVREAEVEIGDKKLKLAVVHGGKNIRTFLDDMKANGKKYDFVEMMACPGGCIGGGGQPRVKMPVANKVREARIKGIYDMDSNMKLRSSYENPEIKAIYTEFFDKPLGELSEQLLHTHFTDRSSDLGVRKDVTPETCPTSPKFKKPE